MNSPQISNYNNNNKLSSNLFLNSNITNSKIVQNYLKSSNNYGRYNDKNDFNCNNKITKIEINNINYNNGKNIIIKNLI